MLSMVVECVLLASACAGLLYYVALECGADRQRAAAADLDPVTGVLTDQAWSTLARAHGSGIEGVHVIALDGLTYIYRRYGDAAVKHVLKTAAERLTTAYALCGLVGLHDRGSGIYEVALWTGAGHQVDRWKMLDGISAAIRWRGATLYVIPKFGADFEAREVEGMRDAALRMCRPRPAAAETAVMAVLGG